jgi:hypothetical protein
MDALINGYSEWVRDEYRSGWTPYYVNLMFDPLKVPQGAINSTMREIIENSFYVMLCKQLDRHPNRKGRHEVSPHVVLFPDLPVFKHNKQSLRDVSLNGGLHYTASSPLHFSRD